MKFGQNIYRLHESQPNSIKFSLFQQKRTLWGQKIILNLFSYFIFLGPFTEYKIWVKAYTWKNEGLQSDSVRYKTDVGGPLPPMITNLTCQSNNTLYVEWKRPRPADYYISVDQYFVIYRSYESNDFEEKIINSSEAFDNVTGLVSNYNLR